MVITFDRDGSQKPARMAIETCGRKTVMSLVITFDRDGSQKPARMAIETCGHKTVMSRIITLIGMGRRNLAFVININKP